MPLLDAADRGAVRRGVVLHLLRGREVVVADGRRRGVADPMAPAKGGQRRVGDRDALRDELFVDADQIAAAAIDPLENLLAVGLRLFGAVNPRHRRGARSVRTVRTVPREICRARAIWRMPWPFACKLRIAVRSP